jgi:hypothetical protein
MTYCIGPYDTTVSQLNPETHATCSEGCSQPHKREKPGHEGAETQGQTPQMPRGGPPRCARDCRAPKDESRRRRQPHRNRQVQPSSPRPAPRPSPPPILRRSIVRWLRKHAAIVVMGADLSRQHAPDGAEPEAKISGEPDATKGRSRTNRAGPEKWAS